MLAQVWSTLAAAYRRFRTWRRGRPFAGGLLLALAGSVILVAPSAQQLFMPVNLLVFSGIAGISSYFIGIMLIGAGAIAWLQPQHHMFVGLAGMLLSVGSFILSNFGGFLLGMLLGIVGASLIVAWSPTAGGDRPRGGVRLLVQRLRRRARSAPGGGQAALSVAAAVPLALSLLAPAQAAAAAPALLDDLCPWCSDEDDEGEPGELPTASPSAPEPTPDPTPTPTEGGEGGGDDDEDGSDEDDDGELGEGDAANCELRVGGVTDDAEQLVQSVRDCAAAEEEGLLPAAPTATEDCFAASVAASGMTAETLTMSGASFDGVVECNTDDGPQEYLQISMDRAEFDSAVLTFEAPGGEASMTQPSMTMDGNVVMHVTSMTISLPIVGIPITFTPDFPPPLLIPTVDGLEVEQPLARADATSIGGLEMEY